MNDLQKNKLKDAKKLVDMGLMDEYQYQDIKRETEGSYKRNTIFIVIFLVVTYLISHYLNIN